MGTAEAIELAAAVSAATSGLLVLVRRSGAAAGWLLLATATAIPPVIVPTPTTALPFTASLVVVGSAGPVGAVLAAAAGVLWPVTPVRRPEVVVIIATIACVGVLGGLLPALLFDPQDMGCNACPPNLLQIHGSVTAMEASVRAAQWLTLLCGPALAAWAAARWVQGSPLAQRSSWPMLGGGAGIALLAATSAAHGLRLPVGQVDATIRTMWLAQCAFVVTIAAGVMVRAYRIRTAATRMRRLVLAAIPEPSTVIGSLRRIVDDPHLSVCFPLHDSSAVDLDGTSIEPGADQAVVRLSRNRAPFAEIRFDRRHAGSADLVRASAASASLALEYLAARARLRAQLAAAAAARARLVAAGDAERRRLERNLHDGAQQRLIALGLMLSAATARPADGHGTAEVAKFRAAHAEIDRALEELRSVARGLFPTSLTEAGIASALRELGDHTPCPLVVDGGLVDPVPPTAAMAMYQAVAEFARISPAGTPVTVELNGGGDAPARMTVISPLLRPGDVGHCLVHAEDRFVAAGGRLTIATTDRGVILEGVAPCGS